MSHIFNLKNLKEADVKAIGGLSPDDRETPGIGEIADVAVDAVPRFRESVQAARGIKQWWKAAKRACRSLKEANSETALGFLLRKGVQVVANDWYQQTETVWRDVCLTTGSDTIAEWYAPLYGTVIADRVQRGGRFPEARLQGEDSYLVNQKFGLVLPIERELFDDDRTGQIRDSASKLGWSMAVTESIWWIYKFLGTERTYMNVTVPASGYSTVDINGTTVSTPFSTSIYGSYGNRPTTYGTLNMGHLKAAHVALRNTLDPLGNKIQVNPNCLLISSQDTLNAKLLTAEGYYPAVIGQSDAALANNPVLGGTSATAGTSQGALTGFAGGVMSQNPFGGLGWKVTEERYAPDWMWALGEAKKGIVFQERDPLEIIQEAPNSGGWFSFDVVNWRSRRRFEVDWIGGGSRFWYLGNDGTVTGNN